MNNPLLSIVIANYNYGRFLEEAIQSVLSQSCDDYELIIVDGGSTDNSVEIIKKYEDKIAWWVSEKDKGQSDAFNKGFTHANGKYLTWLNADDLLIPNRLGKLIAYLKMHPDVEWASGETVYVDINYKLVTTGLRISNWIANFFRAPAWARITAPSTIFTKDLLTRAGGIDESLHYVMDTELWMRFNKMGVKLHYVNFDFWVFRLHEESKTSSSVLTGNRSERFMEERALIRKRHGIGKFADVKAVFLKRVCSFLSLGYLRRCLFLRKYKGRCLNEIWR